MRFSERSCPPVFRNTTKGAYCALGLDVIILLFYYSVFLTAASYPKKYFYTSPHPQKRATDFCTAYSKSMPKSRQKIGKKNWQHQKKWQKGVKKRWQKGVKKGGKKAAIRQ